MIIYQIFFNTCDIFLLLKSYSRWSSNPLAVNSYGHPEKGDIPVCLNCGSERKFEFQIMPQLLYYLKIEQATQLGTNEAFENKRDQVIFLRFLIFLIIAYQDL